MEPHSSTFVATLMSLHAGALVPALPCTVTQKQAASPLAMASSTTCCCCSNVEPSGMPRNVSCTLQDGGSNTGKSSTVQFHAATVPGEEEVLLYGTSVKAPSAVVM